ncbi:MAG: putative porin [Oceanicoccus sp.]|jgi:predicted porin
MNLKSMSIAICALTATSMGVYADDVIVYGNAKLSVNNYDLESSSPNKDNWELESNNSRLGVKGEVKISDNLTAIYQLEYQIYIDDGDSGSGKGNDTFEQRNIFAGLKGNFGTIIAGKHDTPTKGAQGKIDRFNDLPLGDIGNIFEGENRQSNIVMYTTPDMGKFSFTGAIVPGEDSGSGGDDGLADGISIALKYKTDNLYLALAGDSDIDSRDTARFVAEYKMGTAKLGFMYQDAELADASPVQKEDEDGYLISGEYGVNKNVVLKAQYSYNEIDTFNSEDEKTQLAVGADYQLSKAAKVFVYYSMIETDKEGGNDIEDSTFAIGYDLKF